MKKYYVELVKYFTSPKAFSKDIEASWSIGFYDTIEEAAEEFEEQVRFNIDDSYGVILSLVDVELNQEGEIIGISDTLEILKEE